MKKITLVLTGHMRCWHKVFPNTFERIIDKFNPDIHIHTWDNEGYWVSPEQDVAGQGTNVFSPPLNVESVKNFYRPVRMEVLTQKDYLAVFQDMGNVFLPYCNEIRPANILSQFFIQKQGLKRMYTGADLVVRMRPDLVFNDEAITDYIAEADPSKVYTIHHRNHTGQGTGDMFIMGNPTVMQNIGYMLESTDFQMQTTLKHKRFCPHILVKEAIGDDLVELNVNKTLMHTPNGQYKDWKV